MWECVSVSARARERRGEAARVPRHRVYQCSPSHSAASTTSEPGDLTRASTSESMDAM